MEILAGADSGVAGAPSITGAGVAVSATWVSEVTSFGASLGANSFH
jgi:hypothetical protein